MLVTSTELESPDDHKMVTSTLDNLNCYIWAVVENIRTQWSIELETTVIKSTASLALTHVKESFLTNPKTSELGKVMTPTNAMIEARLSLLGLYQQLCNSLGNPK